MSKTAECIACGEEARHHTMSAVREACPSGDEYGRYRENPTIPDATPQDADAEEHYSREISNESLVNALEGEMRVLEEDVKAAVAELRKLTDTAARRLRQGGGEDSNCRCRWEECDPGEHERMETHPDCPVHDVVADPAPDDPRLPFWCADCDVHYWHPLKVMYDLEDPSCPECDSLFIYPTSDEAPSPRRLRRSTPDGEGDGDGDA